MRGRDKFNKYRKLINALVSCASALPFSYRLRWFERLRGLRGTSGIALRYVFLKSIAKKCGDNVAIYPDAYIFHPENLVIGNNVSIHPMCYLECGESPSEGLILGDDISIAHGATLMSTTHNSSNVNVPIKDQGIKTIRTVIDGDVWIGAKATIVAGVTIASGCIIGANSVVTKNTNQYGVYVGSPARRIKDRI